MQRSSLGLLLPMLLAAGITQTHGVRRNVFREEAPEKKEPPVHKGLKPFVIDGKVVMALNEKNARRKAARL